MKDWRLAGLGLGLGVLLTAGLAEAQASRVFGDGKRYEYKEDPVDKAFERTRFARALETGNPAPECAQFLGGMFTLLAEAAPRFHTADDSFFLEPPLVNALQTQLSLRNFSAVAYFQLMVRQVRVNKKLPPEWLAVAEEVNKVVQIIDLGKLRFLADGVQPIDSFYATLPVLMERHHVEVEQANSSVSATAEAAFRDGYLDHTVVFGGLVLMDVQRADAVKRKGKGKRAKHAASADDEDDEGPGYVARMEYRPAKHEEMRKVEIPFFRKPKEPVFPVTAYLTPKQYVDMKALPKGTRVMVRGRFSDYSANFTAFELRDALLFEDRDFSKGVILAQPQMVARCGLAVNDLHGLAPNQAGGFHH